MMSHWIRISLLAVIACASAGFCQAQVTLPAFARGWYDDTGFNEAANPNYFVGDGRGPIGGSTLTEARNFFAFDLTEVTEPITNAVISLYVPPVVGFFSGDPTETYVLSHVEFSAEYVTLAADDLRVFDDLGDGEVFASREFVPFDVGTQVEIPLNAAALVELNERREDSFDPQFIVGGSISTLNQFPDDEFLFAFTPEVPFEDTRLILNRSALPDSDFNDDGTFDCLDVDALTFEIASGQNSTEFDLNGDGLIDQMYVGDMGDAGAANLPTQASYQFGDANLDGSVDVPDFNVWNENKFTNVSGWCSGDFNADGSADVSDFNAWNENKFTSAARPVPEPAIQAVDVLAFVSVLLAFRRLGRE